MSGNAALQLECRFSLAPNSLGYCGKDSAPAKFRRCIIEGDCAGVEEEVGKFIVLYPYLKTISETTGLSPFSYKVVEGYWIGNDVLKKTKSKDYELLLKNFKNQGVPEFFTEELRLKQPKVFIPSHLFQVLHVGVGKASGAVPFNLDSINNCMIRWGKVEQINKDKMTLKLNSLKLADKDKYKLTTKRQTFTFEKELVKGVKVGDTVAVHWEQVIKVLNMDESKKIDFWTKEVLNSL